MRRVLQIVVKQFILPLDSVHGLAHWKRVEALGLYLSQFTKADIAVVRHFAYLHDSQRLSNDEDIQHGVRAKAYVADLICKGALSLSRTQERLLHIACETHNTAHASPEDQTVSTCLDADRLDLWRLGIQPSERLLFTAVGKKISNDKKLYDQITESIYGGTP